MGRILIVDDDPLFGARTARMLEEAGFICHFHLGPFGTLDAIRRTQCDAMLLDVVMPKLDGAMLARLSRDAFGDRVKIFLCSEMEEDVLRRLARTLHVDGVLPKRKRPEELVDYLRERLGTQGQPRQE